MSNHLYESVAHVALPSHYTHRDKSILMALCYRANADQGFRIWASASDLARIACCSLRNIMSKLRMFVCDGILKRLTNPKPRKQPDGSCKTAPVHYELNVSKLIELGAKISLKLHTKENPTTTKNKSVDKKIEPQEFLATAEAKQAIQAFESQNALVDTVGSLKAFVGHYIEIRKTKITAHWRETLLSWLQKEKRVKSYEDRSGTQQAEYWQRQAGQGQLSRRRARMIACGVQALPGRSLDEIDRLCEMIEKGKANVSIEKPEAEVVVLAKPEVANSYLTKIKGMFK